MTIERQTCARCKLPRGFIKHLPDDCITDLRDELDAMYSGGGKAMADEIVRLRRTSQREEGALREKVSLAEARVRELEAVLRFIERGEIPKVYDEKLGREVAYAVLYGSNGERDYMRDKARAVLASAEPREPDPVAPWPECVKCGNPFAPRGSLSIYPMCCVCDPKPDAGETEGR